MGKYCNFALFSCILALVANNASALVLSKAGAELPGTVYRHTAVWDGEDTIFIAGGFQRLSSARQSDGILAYSISTDSVREVGKLPWAALGWASFLSEDDGHILFYLSADPQPGYPYYLPNFGYVYKFNPVTFEGEIIRHTASLVTGLGTTKVGPDEVLFLGGDGKFGVSYFNLTTLGFRKVADLPLPDRETRAVSGTWDGNDKVYIFSQGDSSSRPELNMLVYNLEDNSIVPINSTNVDILYPSSGLGRPQGVWDGSRYVYILGGGGVTGPSTNRMDAIIQFDPATELTVTYAVEFSPGTNMKGLDDAATVFVPHLKRIYLFGGLLWNNSAQRSIWYVDLEE